MSSSVLSGKLLSKQGELEYDSITAPVLCVYFSAHWCPPCRNFTPKLAALYNNWNKNQKRVEIIFSSSDNDQTSFQEYFNSMPWLALPLGDPRSSALEEMCDVQGIPMLVMIGRDGSVLYPDVRDLIEDTGEDALATLESLLA